jgi:hypothetical protein
MCVESLINNTPWLDDFESNPDFDEVENKKFKAISDQSTAVSSHTITFTMASLS